MRQQTGSILLEALIGIVLFLIGILGLAGLYTASMKNAGEAQYRAEAIAMANSLIAEMRTANPTTRPTGYKEGGTDYSRWVSRIKNTSNGVPGAMPTPLSITIVPTRNAVSVTVHWQPKNAGNGVTPTPHHYTLNTVLD
jgi:type IV pilus assembly protein PilV